MLSSAVEGFVELFVGVLEESFVDAASFARVSDD